MFNQEEQMLKRFALAATALLVGSAPAFAHLDPGAHGSFLAGVSHPLFGLDHILAMVAVGLWAAQTGGRAVFLVPAAFVATMSVGYILGMSRLTLPFVEPAILASVVVLGLLVAASVRLPLGFSTLVVGVFALFHGHAHAAEIGSAGALSFAFGFAAATALLHFAGIGLGAFLGSSGSRFGQRAGSMLTRALGACTAVAGLVLMAG